MKFRDLFSKQAPGSIKNVRSTSQPTIADREATARKIDAIESEITAELDGYSDAENSTDRGIDSDLPVANNIEQ